MKNSKINRSPNRNVHDELELHHLLDKHYLFHIAFQNQDGPVIIPMMYGRSGNTLYVHGSIKSSLMQKLEEGVQVCLSIASVLGIVLARSVFNHSLNYESFVIIGKSSKVKADSKMKALIPI